MGRSGLWKGALPNGILWPITRDEIIRSAEVVHDKIKGGPEWPLTAGERREKFLSCAKSAAFPLSRPSAEKALARLERLDKAEDIRPLIERLSAVNKGFINNIQDPSICILRTGSALII